MIPRAPPAANTCVINTRRIRGYRENSGSVEPSQGAVPSFLSRLAEMLRACDCGSWSTEDAQRWWDEYGEAARSESAPEETQAASVQSQIEVVVGATRS